MRTDEAKKAFSWGTDNSDLTVRHTAVFSGVGAGIILCAGFETVQESVLRLEPGRMSPPLKWTQFISAMGAPLGWTGGAAFQVLEGRSYVPRWQLYLYASAFVISGFALLLQWFGVSGARDWRS